MKNKIIIFCNDGWLRTKTVDGKLVALKSIQEKTKEDDVEFLSSWFNNKVMFEDGTTVGTFFKCFSPWVNHLNKYTKINLSKYIEKCKKPRLIKETNYQYFLINTIHGTFNGFHFLGEEDFINYTKVSVVRGFGFNDTFKNITECIFDDVIHLPLLLNKTQTHMIQEESISPVAANKYIYNDFLKAKKIKKRSKPGYDVISYWTSKKDYLFKEIIDEVLPFFKKEPPTTENESIEFNEVVKDILTRLELEDESLYEVSNQLLSKEDLFLKTVLEIQNTPSKIGEIKEQQIPKDIMLF